jgi:hypothetical protein
MIDVSFQFVGLNDGSIGYNACCELMDLGTGGHRKTAHRDRNGATIWAQGVLGGWYINSAGHVAIGVTLFGVDIISLTTSKHENSRSVRCSMLFRFTSEHDGTPYLGVEAFTESDEYKE